MKSEITREPCDLHLKAGIGAHDTNKPKLHSFSELISYFVYL